MCAIPAETIIMGCIHAKKTMMIPERLERALKPNHDTQYMLWNECVKDLLAAYGGKFKDIVITIRLILLFCDGTSKLTHLNLHYNGLVQKCAFYCLRREIVSFMWAPYCFYGDYLSFYNNVSLCKFNCILNIVVINL